MISVNRLSPPAMGNRLRTALGALRICIGGLATGVLGLLLFPFDAVFAGVGLAGTVAGDQLSSHKIQLGFAVFALLYLARRDSIERYVRVRRPTLTDIAWLIGIVVAVPLLSTLVGHVLGVIGMPATGTHGEVVALYEHPAAIPALFVGLYLFAAPVEELVYRGLIHGRLRDAFSTRDRVLLAGFLFGLMHLLVGFLTPGTTVVGAVRWGVTACVPGLVWGLAYERTDNLAVTVVGHAISWTIPVAAFLGL